MNSRENYKEMAEVINPTAANRGAFYIATEENYTSFLGRIEMLEVKENSVSLLQENCFMWKDDQFTETPLRADWTFSIEPSEGFLDTSPKGSAGHSHLLNVCEVVVIQIFSTWESFKRGVAERMGEKAEEKIPKGI